MTTIRRFGVLRAASSVAAGAVLLLALAACGSGAGSGSGSGSGSGAADQQASSGSPSPSPAQYDTATMDEVADWIAGQTDNGLAHDRQYGVDNYSLSADIGLGLAAVGGHDNQVAVIANAVAKNLDHYISPGYGTVTSAGSAAKALVLEQTAGALNDSSLVDTLEHTIVPSGPAAGRIQDELDPKNKKAADYSNTIGQAFAVEGLSVAGSDRADAATDFLLHQQCSAGWFRLYFNPDPTKKKQSCDSDPSATPDVDVTAYAVLALSSVDDPSAAVTRSIDAAVSWLASQQAGDGSFDAAKPKVPNSDSTGLAGWALGTAGRTDAAEKAATWVGKHVVTCGDAKGAVAYDDAALAQGEKKGITKTTEGQFRLATAQALPALQWLPEGVVESGSC